MSNVASVTKPKIISYPGAARIIRRSVKSYGSNSPRVGIVSVIDPRTQPSILQGCDPALRTIGQLVERHGIMSQVHRLAEQPWWDATEEIQELAESCDFIITAGGSSVDQLLIGFAMSQIQFKVLGFFTTRAGGVTVRTRAMFGYAHVDATLGQKPPVPVLSLLGRTYKDQRLVEFLVVPAVRKLLGLSPINMPPPPNALFVP